MAGYDVVAIDAYADTQTMALCQQVLVVDYQQQGFDADALLAAVNSLNLKQFEGFVYGSGFEAQPKLLYEIAHKLPLIGNSAQIVAQVKNPVSFFAQLRQCNIRYPALFATVAKESPVMLIKTVGASGGGHIQHADLATVSLDDANYLQQKIEGDAVSLLFIANTQHIEIIGFNLQWVNAATYAPYRYGGAAANADLSSCVKAQLISAAEKLTSAFGLRGLNSLDAIVQQDAVGAQVYVLEINPRLSATFDLYAHATKNLFEQHVQACLAFALFQQQETAKPVSKAHAIVYAEQDVCFSSDFNWPRWVKDNPLSFTQTANIRCGEPICSVTAEAETAQAAKALVQSRVEHILQLLKQK